MPADTSLNGIKAPVAADVQTKFVIDLRISEMRANKPLAARAPQHNEMLRRQMVTINESGSRAAIQ